MKKKIKGTSTMSKNKLGSKKEIYKSRGGAVLYEDYLTDENVINIDGVEYLTDPHTNEDEDIITLEKIRKDRAILVNNQIYDIESIYKWTISYNHTYCPLRTKIDAATIGRIQQKYNNVFGIITPEYRVHIGKSYNNVDVIYFHENIARGDILLLNDGTHIFSATWYIGNIGHAFIWGCAKLNSPTISVNLISPTKIIGYVLMTETDKYNALLSAT